MAEQRSSKPHAWVRFLLSLFLMLFKLTRQTKKISKVQNPKRRVNLLKYKIKRLNRTAPKFAKVSKMPKIGTWVQRVNTRTPMRVNRKRMSSWYKRVPFGAMYLARYISRTDSSSDKRRKQQPLFHVKRAFTTRTFVWSSEEVFSHSTANLMPTPTLFLSPVHSCTSSPVQSYSVLAPQFTKKLLTWLNESATTPYLLNLTKTTQSPTVSTFSNQLFFRNNLNFLSGSKSQETWGFGKQSGVTLGAWVRSKKLRKGRARRIRTSYHHFLRKFLLGDVRTTRALKTFYIKARKARTYINEIPSSLFFSAGVIRVSHVLTKVESRVNITRYKRQRLNLTRRGLVKFFTLLTSPKQSPKLRSRRLRRLEPKNHHKLLNASGIDSTSTNLNYLLRDGRFSSALSTNALLTKFLYLDRTLLSGTNSANSSQLEARSRALSLDSLTFSSRNDSLAKLNLIPTQLFKFALKRKLLRILNFHKFSSNVTLWYYNTLIRFIESCSGKKVYTKFNPFIENSLSFEDLARCSMWHSRITAFQRLLGPKIFLKESLKILHIAIKFKDPTFFANWVKGMLYRMSFWKYRLLFRYIKYAMRYLFWLHFPRLGFKGLKLRLKGKISVAGNARTRTLLYRIGETGYSKFNNRVVSDYSTINTFTGVLGFKVWFFF